MAAVSAPVLMSLDVSDSDIPMKVPFTFRNKQTLPAQLWAVGPTELELLFGRHPRKVWLGNREPPSKWADHPPE